MSVYSVGSNKFGQLGRKATKKTEVDYDVLAHFKGTTIVEMAAGQHFSLAVADLGDVWVWGRAKEGQHGNGERKATSMAVGLPESEAVTAASSAAEPVASQEVAADGTLCSEGIPTRVWSLRHERIAHIAAGNFHCLAVSESGRLYEWGRLFEYEGSKGAEIQYFGTTVQMPGMHLREILDESRNEYFAAGLDADELKEIVDVTNFGAFKPFVQTVPRPVKGLASMKVTSIAAGYSFSIAVIDDGRCYGWGYNEKFQLGLGHRYNQDKPVKIVFPLAEDGQEPRIVSAACGEQHMLALSRNGAVYSCGLGVFGQLGHGSKRDERRPRCIASFIGQPPIKQVACGNHHSVAVDQEGNVWLWGHAEYSQLGGANKHEDWARDKDGDARPVKVEFFRKGLKEPRSVRQVACGDLFTCALTTKNEVFAWGWNTSGALGTGNRRYQLVPVQAARLKGERIGYLAAGGRHALAVTEGNAGTFAFDFQEPLLNGTYADICFIVKKTPFWAHRAIVFTRCRYLAAQVALQQRFCRGPDQRSNQWLISDIKLHVFRSLLTFLYTDHLQCAAYFLKDLRDLAKRYQLPRLAFLCDLQLNKNANDATPPVGSSFVFDMNIAVDSPLFSDFQFRIHLSDAASASSTSSSFSAPSTFSGKGKDKQKAKTKGKGKGIKKVVKKKEAEIEVVKATMEEVYITVNAHRVILSARCDYFKRLFEGRFKERQYMDLYGMEPETLYSVLRFIYTGDEMDISDGELVVPLLMAADRFLMTDLKQLCEVQLEAALDADNVSCLLILADRYGAPRLRKACCTLIQVCWPQLRDQRSLVDLALDDPALLQEMDRLLSAKKLIEPSILYNTVMEQTLHNNF